MFFFTHVYVTLRREVLLETPKGVWKVHVVPTYLDRVVLFKLCSEKWPESKGKWVTPGDDGLPEENPDRAAMRICQNDMGELPGEVAFQYLFHAHRFQGDKPCWILVYECRLESLEQVPARSPNLDVDAVGLFSLGELPPLANMITCQSIHFALARQSFR